VNDENIIDFGVDCGSHLCFMKKPIIKNRWGDQITPSQVAKILKCDVCVKGKDDVTFTKHSTELNINITKEFPSFSLIHHTHTTANTNKTLK